MAKILILSYHGYGHVNPFISAARLLGREGNVCAIAAAAFFARYIQSAEVKAYRLRSVPFASDFEKWKYSQDKRSSLYFAELTGRFCDELYTQRAAELLSIVDEFLPEVLLIDAMLSTDFIVLYPFIKQRRIKVAIIHTMLPTQVTPSSPPINSLSTDLTQESLEEEFIRFRKTWRLKNFKQLLRWAGLTDRYLWRRRAERNQVPGKYLTEGIGPLSLYLNNIDEFILAPAEFELPLRRKVNASFVGFLPANQPIQPADASYMQQRGNILTRKIESGKALVYCSFGTIDPKREVELRAFFRKLVAIASRTGNIVVISTNLVIDAELPANVFTFPSVYQLDLLEVIDLFISHGGINSIGEAVANEVPLLIYPVHPRFDGRGNSVRVQQLGLGLTGDIIADQEPELERKMNELLTNSFYRERLREFRMTNQSYEGKLLDVIKKLSPINDP
jgi:zeaxanthin glucosyltransferase